MRLELQNQEWLVMQVQTTAELSVTKSEVLGLSSDRDGDGFRCRHVPVTNAPISGIRVVVLVRAVVSSQFARPSFLLAGVLTDAHRGQRAAFALVRGIIDRMRKGGCCQVANG